jgi:hypothetical protein
MRASALRCALPAPRQSHSLAEPVEIGCDLRPRNDGASAYVPPRGRRCGSMLRAAKMASIAVSRFNRGPS